MLLNGRIRKNIEFKLRNRTMSYRNNLCHEASLQNSLNDQIRRIRTRTKSMSKCLRNDYC